MGGFFNNPAPPEQFDFVVNSGSSSAGPFLGPTPTLLTIGPAGPGSLASAYVGDSPGLAVEVTMAGVDSGSDPWIFAIVWSRVPFGATDLWPGPPSGAGTDPAGNLAVIEAYMGDADCLIFDNLPVIAPYASVWVGPQNPGSVNGVGFGGGQVTNSASSLRGPVALPMLALPTTPDGIAPSGYLVSVVESVPAAGDLSFYSPVLAPGPHQLYLEADVATPTDQAFAQFEFPLDQQPNLIMTQATQNLAGIKQFQGAVLVPNVQPRVRFINDTGASVEMAGQLARPAGSS